MFSSQFSPLQPSLAFFELDYPHDGLLMGDFPRESPLLWYSHENSYSTPTGSTGPPFLNTVASSIDAAGQRSLSRSGLGVHCQPLQSYPRSWPWTPAEMHATISTASKPFPSLNIDKKSAAVPICQSAVEPPPSAMAVSPTPNLIPHDSVISSSVLPASSADSDPYYSVPGSMTIFRVPGTATVQNVIGKTAREKKRGCWMCHKSFDRLSTLRKHLLVHTGEKAHVCVTCGRRFAVLSNLNRHVKNVKRCQSATGTSTDSRQGQPSWPSTDLKQHKVTKRRRRAPSPSQWIPFSLLAFNLNPIEFHMSTVRPLPPVTPSATEERDSWDENVGAAPYREDWKGKLPGPGLTNTGLGRRNIGNSDNHSGYFIGRLSF